MTRSGTHITRQEKDKAINHIHLVHARLGECLASFMLFKEIEELREKSPLLISPTVKFGNFWREVRYCALSKVIIDIGALVDEKFERNCTASLPSLYIQCVDLRGTHCPDAMVRIDSVRKTWKNYRSKLIAHTDRRRVSLIENFGREYFTLEKIKSQIDDLCYAFASLEAVLRGYEPPTFEDAMRFESGFVAVGERVRQDTKAFLDAVSSFVLPPP